MFFCDACYAEKDEGVSVAALAKAKVLVTTASQSMYGICDITNADHVGKVLRAAAKAHYNRSGPVSSYPIILTEYEG